MSGTGGQHAFQGFFEEMQGSDACLPARSRETHGPTASLLPVQYNEVARTTCNWEGSFASAPFKVFVGRQRRAKFPLPAWTLGLQAESSPSEDGSRGLRPFLAVNVARESRQCCSRCKAVRLGTYQRDGYLAWNTARTSPTHAGAVKCLRTLDQSYPTFYYASYARVYM